MKFNRIDELEAELSQTFSEYDFKYKTNFFKKYISNTYEKFEQLLVLDDNESLIEQIKVKFSPIIENQKSSLETSQNKAVKE